METEEKQKKKQKTHYDPQNGPRIRAALVASGDLVPAENVAPQAFSHGVPVLRIVDSGARPK